MNRLVRAKYGPICLVLGMLSLLISLVVLFGVRAHQGDVRCESLGGQTWDHGYHCIIGDYQVVNVR